jgi:hypothetical protein
MNLADSRRGQAGAIAAVARDLVDVVEEKSRSGADFFAGGDTAGVRDRGRRLRSGASAQRIGVP